MDWEEIVTNNTMKGGAASIKINYPPANFRQKYLVFKC